jgi:hypothetical protein
MTEIQEQEVILPSIIEETQSTDIGKIAGALAKAQTSMVGAKATSTNPFFSSSYADLSEVIKACIGALNSNEIAVTQGSRMDKETGRFYVTTRLIHSSGQWLYSEVAMPIGGKKDAHALGSAFTYGRRYLLSAMVGIAQVDDDANLNIERAPRKQKSNYKTGVQA